MPVASDVVLMVLSSLTASCRSGVSAELQFVTESHNIMFVALFAVSRLFRASVSLFLFARAPSLPSTAKYLSSGSFVDAAGEPIPPRERRMQPCLFL